MPETYEDAKDPVPVSQETQAMKEEAARAGKQPQAVAALSLSASWSLARVVLINDYEGQGVPVLSFSANQVRSAT